VVVIVRAVGSVMVEVVVDEHPFASVIIYDCVPALWENEPIPAYGAVPPVALTETVAVPPAHKIGAITEALPTRTAGSVTVKFCVVMHPLASVTVTVYVPEVKLFAVCVFAGKGDHT
jgi:hypothetical protein